MGAVDGGWFALDLTRGVPDGVVGLVLPRVGSPELKLPCPAEIYVGSEQQGLIVELNVYN